MHTIRSKMIISTVFFDGYCYFRGGGFFLHICFCLCRVRVLEMWRLLCEKVDPSHGGEYANGKTSNGFMIKKNDLYLDDSGEP